MEPDKPYVHEVLIAEHEQLATPQQREELARAAQELADRHDVWRSDTARACWDVVTGLVYFVDDARCPLLTRERLRAELVGVHDDGVGSALDDGLPESWGSGLMTIVDVLIVTEVHEIR